MLEEGFGAYLQAKSRTANAIFHRFRIEVASGRRNALFLEGYDDQLYYCHFLPIGDFRSDTIILTFGKKNMDRIIELYHGGSYGDRCKTRFIRDADFDEFLNVLPSGEGVAVLDRYSVENFVFTPKALRRFLLEKVCLNKTEIDVNQIVQDYQDLLDRCFQGLLPFIDHVFRNIQSGQTLDLNQLKISDHVANYLQTGAEIELTESDLTACKITDIDMAREPSERSVQFISREAGRWIRGHYLSQICSKYLSRKMQHLNDLRKSGQITSFNRALSPDLSPSTLLERLATLDEAGANWLTHALS